MPPHTESIIKVLPPASDVTKRESYRSNQFTQHDLPPELSSSASSLSQSGSSTPKEPINPDDLPEVPNDVIQRIRSRFLNHYHSLDDDQKKVYKRSDVEEFVVKKDTQICRYFMAADDGDENMAIEAMKEFLKYAKEVNLTGLTDQSFPAEFFATGGLFAYNSDVNGVPMLYMRVQMVKKIPELEDWMKLFLAHQIYKIDKSATADHGLCGWGIVFDCSNIGISNVQIDLMKFLIHLLKDFFPFGIKYVLVYDLPWILSAVQKMIFSMVPDEAKQLIQFKNKKTISKSIPLENLPDYMGGTCDLNYRKIPDNCKTFDEMFEGAFTKSQHEKLLQYFHHWINN